MPDEQDDLNVEENEVVVDDDTTAADDESSADDGFSENDLVQAKNLFKLLKDPSTQVDVLKIMARQAGILSDKKIPETSGEVKQVKRDIVDVLKTNLGPEYSFIADKLGNALKEVLKDAQDETMEHVSQLQLKSIKHESDNALEKLAQETKGLSRGFESQMANLMDKVKPTDNLSTYEYLKMLYQVASSGRSTASAKAQIADRIKRNSGNAAERLQGARTSGSGGKPLGPDKKGLRNAVEFALLQANRK